MEKKKNPYEVCMAFAYIGMAYGDLDNRKISAQEWADSVVKELIKLYNHIPNENSLN